MTLYPVPDKHLSNNTHDQMHTTRRAQVLGQNVNEQTEGMLPAEKVFLRTSPKPIETS